MKKITFILLILLTACCVNKQANYEKKTHALKAINDTIIKDEKIKKIDSKVELYNLFKAVRVVNDSFCEKTFPIDIYNSNIEQIKKLFANNCQPEKIQEDSFFKNYYFNCGNNNMKLYYKKPESNNTKGGFVVDSLNVSDNNFRLSNGLFIGLEKDNFCKIINSPFITRDTILVTNNPSSMWNFFIFNNNKLVKYRIIPYY